MSEYTKELTAEQLIEYIANDYVELSHEKIVVQRNDFMAICQEWLQENLSETCIKQKDYKWVGLTHEDIDKAIEDNQRFGGFRKVGFAYDLESLLKEKNT